MYLLELQDLELQDLVALHPLARRQRGDRCRLRKVAIQAAVAVDIVRLCGQNRIEMRRGRAKFNATAVRSGPAMGRTVLVPMPLPLVVELDPFAHSSGSKQRETTHWKHNYSCNQMSRLDSDSNKGATYPIYWQSHRRTFPGACAAPLIKQLALHIQLLAALSQGRLPLG
jgi:hypothetical protein